MKFYTVADALLELKPAISGGACRNEQVLELLNRAQRRLLNRPKKPVHIRRLLRFFTYKDIITLPHEVEKVLHYTMDGHPAPMFSQAYEFVSGGPGEVGCGTCIAGKFLEDLGNHYSLMFDVPSMSAEEDVAHPVYGAHEIIAFTTAAADRDKELLLVGRNGKNEALGSDNTGARLKLSPWANGVEGNFTVDDNSADFNTLADVRDITWVKKPRTDGFVSLYTYNRTTHQLYFLAKYHPHEVQPRYRRYRITAPDYTCGSSILAWCELGHVVHTHADEVIVVQNLDALKLMVMALVMEQERDFQLAKQYEADAYRLIDDQRMSERTHDHNLIQVSQQYGFGGIGVRY